MLTEIEIKALKPSAKIQKVFDGGGLFLMVLPTGTKTWHFRYRTLNKERKVSFGPYPLIGLKDARQKRDEAKRKLLEGIDPAIEKQNLKRLARYNEANTFKAAAEEWLDLNQSKWVPEYAQIVRRRLEIHLYPSLGNRPLKEIRSLELLDVLRKAEHRGVHLAHRLLQMSKLIFRYALVTERVEKNPAENLQGLLKSYTHTHYPTLEPKELPDFLAELKTVETTAINRMAIKLLMLTMLRQGELRFSKWVDINWEAKEWVIPAENTKMRDEHIVPLATHTIAALEELKALTGWSKYLFPSQQRIKNPVMSENTINIVIERMGYKGRIVGHGFRALASTVLNEKGFRSDVIERQLAHKERNKIRAAYNRAEYLPDRCEMMQWWAEYLQERGL